MRNWLLLWGLCGALTLAADGPGGLKPRRDVADYPVQTGSPELTTGAVQLSPAEVTRLFSKEVNNNYVVIEVGVFPKGSNVELHAVDFSLRVGANSAAIRPITAESVASALYRRKPSDVKPMPRSETDVITEAHVGYESGRVYDPNTGRNRGGGVYGGGGVGVVNGPADPRRSPDPGGSNRDQAQRVLQYALEDRALPEGGTSTPVAGYLYFPLTTAKRQHVAYELQFDTPAQRLSLPLPPVDK